MPVRSIGAAALAMLLASGCAPSPKPPPVVVRNTQPNDACSEQLHDLSGQLLVHFLMYQQLPATLEELTERQAVPMECPGSGQRYLYDPAGVELPNQQGRLIVCDAEPSHNGLRWGIVMKQAPSQPMTANVIPLDEQTFAAAVGQQ